MKERLAGIIVMVLMGGWAQGANRTWTNGSGSGLWTNAANWNLAVVPGSADFAVFDNTKIGTSLLDNDLTLGNYRCLNTSGTNVLRISAGKTLTVSGASAFFFPASGTQNSNLIVSNGTLKLTGGGSLYVAVGGSAASTSSSWTAFRDVTVNFENAKRLFVGYTTYSASDRQAYGTLDLSEATIKSGTTPNSIKLSGDTTDPWGLQVGRNRSYATLKLPPAVTNIEAQAFSLGGFDTLPKTSWIDLGVNPQLKKIKVNSNGGFFYNFFGDFTYSDGTTTYTGLPAGVAMELGSAATPITFYLGYAHWVYGTPTSTLLRRSWGGFSRFDAYLIDAFVGHAQSASYHYSSTELDLSKAAVSFYGSSSDFFVRYRLGVGQYEKVGSGKSDGKLRLPPSIVSLTCTNFAFGGFAATNASLVQFGTNTFHTLTCKKDFYFNNGRFRHVTPSGATNDGFSAAGITLKLGTLNNRGVLEVGRCNSSASYSGEAVLSGITNLQAYLTSILIGQNTGTTYPTTGVLDLRGARLAPLNVSGTVQLCDAGKTRASLYMSDGTATVGTVTMALNNNNTASLWTSNFVLTVTDTFKMGKAAGVACSATFTNIVAGKSSGIDLLTSTPSKFVIQNTGAIKVIFRAEPVRIKDACWGLRMSGDQTALFEQMIADGRLTWETPGMPHAAAWLGVYYEDGKTYFGVPPNRATILLIR